MLKIFGKIENSVVDAPIMLSLSLLHKRDEFSAAMSNDCEIADEREYHDYCTSKVNHAMIV